MIAKLKAAGAHDVIQHGPTWQDADRYLRDVVIGKNNTSAIYAPPFDHPDIWTGHSSMVPEIFNELKVSRSTPVTLVCSVGGGGLLNGIMQGLDQYFPETSLGVQQPTVLAVETRGAESLNASVRAGKLVTLDGITSQATSLGARQVTPQTLEYAQRENVKSVVLDDSEAAMACCRLADDERVMVELACGVNVALCYDGRLEKALGRKVQKDEVVVIVLCGGSNVTIDMLANWRNEYASVFGQTEGEKIGNGNVEPVPSATTLPQNA
jgi:L-serine/L-threonine ammonia-lyase